MKENFDKSFTLLCGFEGFSSDVIGDPGGRTIWGIAERYFPEDVKTMAAMTAGDARAYAKAWYKKNVWDKLGCDDRPFPMDMAVFDCGVNPGTGFVTRSLPDCKDWKDLLFRREDYYLSEIGAEASKKMFEDGWFHRVVKLWKLLK